MGWNAELLAFVAPLLMCAYAAIRHYGKVVWWEIALSVLLCTTLLFAGHYFVVMQMESDSQFGVEHIDRAVYKERYTYTVMVTRRIGKRSYLTTETRVSPARWYVVGNLGTEKNISEDYFEWFKSEWSNSSTSGHFETISWLGGELPKQFISTEESYLNPLQLTRRAYAYPKLKDEVLAQFALQQYPEVGDELVTPQILGAVGESVDSSDLARAEDMLRTLNSTAGQERKFQAWIVVFPDMPTKAAELQEALWCNGNHNEFVVCIGTKGKNVAWTKAFSWTEQDALIEHFTRIEPEQEHSPHPLSLTETVSTLQQALVGSWAPHDLQKYRMLDVEIPWWGIFLIGFISCGVNGLFLYWAVENDHESETFEGK